MVNDTYTPKRRAHWMRCWTADMTPHAGAVHAGVLAMMVREGTQHNVDGIVIEAHARVLPSLKAAAQRHRRRDDVCARRLQALRGCARRWPHVRAAGLLRAQARRRQRQGAAALRRLPACSFLRAGAPAGGLAALPQGGLCCAQGSHR
jgi:hypothetical protein